MACDFGPQKVFPAYTAMRERYWLLATATVEDKYVERPIDDFPTFCGLFFVM